MTFLWLRKISPQFRATPWPIEKKPEPLKNDNWQTSTTLWYTNIAGWNIPMFNRKYIFKPGPFSSQLCSFTRVIQIHVLPNIYQIIYNLPSKGVSNSSKKAGFAISCSPLKKTLAKNRSRNESTRRKTAPLKGWCWKKRLPKRENEAGKLVGGCFPNPSGKYSQNWIMNPQQSGWNFNNYKGNSPW